MTTKNAVLSQKQDRFMSAPKFAVVGASANSTKNGFKAFKWLLGQHKDVVPVNPNTPEIQGVKTLKSLSELPDPTHTAVSIVVPPAATLEVLKLAKSLGIYAVWIQPGAEDDAVEKFIEADTQLEERCIYRSHALNDHAPTPSRTRSKPEPLSTSTNLLASNLVKAPSDGTLGPCLWGGITPLPALSVAVETPTAAPAVSAASVVASAIVQTPTTLSAAVETPAAAPAVSAAPIVAPAVVQTPHTFEQKKAVFLSALKFAVVGASTNDSKNGTKALKWLIASHKDVVPINLNATEIQGIKCLKTLSELPDPTHTAISVVVPAKATLEVLKLAKSLGIYAVWIQPGAEDDAVVEFIEADAQFKARCVYREHPLHTTVHPPPMMLAAKTTLHTDTLGPCLFVEPPVSAAAALPAAPLVASNVVAGVKHVLSPPSTPPVTKSLKLSADTADLGEEIPGLA